VSVEEVSIEYLTPWLQYQISLNCDHLPLSATFIEYVYRHVC